MRLKYLVFLGSVRVSTPPHPERLGLRVAQRCSSLLQERGNDVTLIDPLDFDLGGVFKPHFAYAKNKAPPALDKLAADIGLADGYVMVSPEYNHSMSPALAHLLNHFGSSLFSYKASAIVTYSAGQWGGAHAAVGMRAFLSELGCLPVSAIVHLPTAQEVLMEGGGYAPGVDAERWSSYINRGLGQLEWWAQAARDLRAITPEHSPSPAFRKDPSERNAP